MIENSLKLLYLGIAVIMVVMAAVSFFDTEKSLDLFESSLRESSENLQWLVKGENDYWGDDKEAGILIRNRGKDACCLNYSGRELKLFIDFYEVKDSRFEYVIYEQTKDYPDILLDIDDSGSYIFWQEEEVIHIVGR